MTDKYLHSAQPETLVLKGDPKLSLHHQNKVDTAVLHLANATLSDDLGLGQQLHSIWGDAPLVISTVKHPYLSPPSMHATGQALFNSLEQRAGEAVLSHNITWESDPNGAGLMEFGLGHFSLVVYYPDEAAQWAEKKLSFAQHLTALGIPSSKQDEILVRFDEVQGIATEIFQGYASMVEKTITWEQYLLNGCLLEGDTPITASTKSTITAKQTAQTLAVLESSYVSSTTGKTGLIGVFDDILGGQGKSSLFIGEKSVSYSPKKGRFGINNPKAKGGRRVDSEPIAPEEIIAMVGSGELLAATEAHALTMLLASSQVPVVYHGNTYSFDKYMATIAKRIGMTSTSGLMHLTEEWKDAWYLLELFDVNRMTGYPVTFHPNLLSLKLLLSESQFTTLLQQALSLGEPVKMTMEDYISLLKGDEK